MGVECGGEVEGVECGGEGVGGGRSVVECEGRALVVSGLWLNFEGRVLVVAGLWLNVEGRVLMVPGLWLNVEGRVLVVAGQVLELWLRVEGRVLVGTRNVVVWLAQQEGVVTRGRMCRLVCGEGLCRHESPHLDRPFPSAAGVSWGQLPDIIAQTRIATDVNLLKLTFRDLQVRVNQLEKSAQGLGGYRFLLCPCEALPFVSKSCHQRVTRLHSGLPCVMVYLHRKATLYFTEGENP